ncbi:S-layer homology domain-containing protein [Paenibacillus sp. IITD108]|uniref:S-layer homology domain-containing protein n=1 Tax=Paenibacillus sp. IITD108 TaxID=3116649 RepID=UPI002F426EC7
MKQHIYKKRRLLIAMVFIMAIAGSEIHSSSAEAATKLEDNEKSNNLKENQSVKKKQSTAEKQNTTEKQRLIEIELSVSAATVQFTLESSYGPFLSSLVFPSGYKVEGVTSNKINKPVDSVKTANEVSWQAIYVVNNASAGKYSFFIESEAAPYVGVTYHIPLFSDIANHWAEKQISQFVKSGIVSGVGNGNFAPDRAVTKEAFLKMLILTLSEEKQHGERQWIRSFRWKVIDEELRRELGLQQFSFINKDKQKVWATPFINAASLLGIELDLDQRMRESLLRRDEAAAMIAAVLELTDESSDGRIPKVEFKKSKMDETILEQQVTLRDYSKAIERVQRFSIISGYPDGSFKPERSVTRAEAVVILDRLQQYFNE